MALFLFRGPPIYAAGQGANAAITASVPTPSVVATGGTVFPVVWATVPDQVFIQNETATHALGGYATITGGYPLRLTLAPTSAALPAGVTWNEATKSLVATNPATIGTTAGVRLRATSGVLAGISNFALSPTGETGVTPSVSMAATATQPSPGVFAAITESVPRPAGTVLAEAQQVPPPVGLGYPTTYFVPNDFEYVWSDTDDWVFASTMSNSDPKPTGATHHETFQVPAAVYPHVYGSGPPSPGFYQKDTNAGTQWQHVGGTWADANNVLQGTTAFRTASVIAAPAHNTGSWYSWNIFNLVNLWLNGTFRNAGLWLRGNNTNTINWAGKLDTVVPDRKPYLMLTSLSQGQVRVECARQIMLSSSSESTQTGLWYFQTSGTTQTALLYFDLSAHTAADITGAVLWCYTIDQYGNQTVNVFRCVNPSNQEEDHNTPVPAQRIGVAGNYQKDVGIEADPSVLFVQKFVDDTIQPNGLKYYEDLWIPGGNSGISGGSLIRAADGNGFAPLAGMYNGLKVTTPNGYTGSTISCYWSPWRGHPAYTGPGGKRLKPYVEVEELYFRYYLMWGLDWDPLPDGGKMPGLAGQYALLSSPAALAQPDAPLIPGMGRGNSGSGTDGITGWSVRGNYGRMRTPGSPLEALRSIGNYDFYHADMTSAYGGFFFWNKHYLGNMRKGQWNSVELHVKMNSVTLPEQQPYSVVGWSRVGTVATVILRDPMSLSDPNYQVGQVWTYGGAGSNSFLWEGEHAITSIVDTHTFTYAISASASSTPGQGTDNNQVPTGWWATPSVGNFDGVIEGWINGRLAGQSTGIRFRHSRIRPYGGLLGIDAMWLANLNGGTAPAIGNFSCYFANMIVATQYIGPLTGYP